MGLNGDFWVLNGIHFNLFWNYVQQNGKYSIGENMIKLPDTLQELFNIVSIHLLNQGKMSLNADGFCSYRGENGLMCAAGILIPDEAYKPNMETKRWSTLVDKNLIENKFRNEINDLQNIHDSGSKTNPEQCVIEWKRELIEFATFHNLTHNIE